ncbi:hypothetical protein EDD91_1917 [Streptomyces sp. KS 21]|nr:hypothetical protein EDD91_1917 [Streptomyces sp. KS 21]
MDRDVDEVKTVHLTHEVYGYLVAQAEPPSCVQERSHGRAQAVRPQAVKDGGAFWGDNRTARSPS